MKFIYLVFQIVGLGLNLLNIVLVTFWSLQSWNFDLFEIMLLNLVSNVSQIVLHLLEVVDEFSRWLILSDLIEMVRELSLINEHAAHLTVALLEAIIQDRRVEVTWLFIKAQRLILTLSSFVFKLPWWCSSGKISLVEKNALGSSRDDVVVLSAGPVELGVQFKDLLGSWHVHRVVSFHVTRSWFSFISRAIARTILLDVSHAVFYLHWGNVSELLNLSIYKQILFDELNILTYN